ncbi:hypothetical protein GJAV_G00208150 [Gymnothorax javanicus]|nr:hypothetical protein GJAV_G00208150 [Gymnothorax javanicus]
MAVLGSAGLFLLALCLHSYSSVSRAVENVQQIPQLNSYNYTTYHHMNEISMWMEQVVKENPELVTSEVYGKTYEGNNITLLKIGLASVELKKMIWIDCGIHASEWIAPAFCQWFVKEILQTYKTDERLNLMLKNMDIYVTPVLNVDGYMYSWINESTRLWSKSRSKPAEVGCDCYGTDLNCNFNANWGAVGTSRDCCSDTYCGPKALSEVEAMAVTEFVQKRAKDILCFLTIHSYGQLVFTPYARPEITAPNYNEIIKVGLAAAEEMKSVHGEDYRVGTSPDVMLPNSGNSRDWAQLVGIPFSFTFVLRDRGKHGFLLPEEQIRPACEEAYVGARSIINYVHDWAFNLTTTTAIPLTTASAATASATLWTSLLFFCLTTAAPL